MKGKVAMVAALSLRLWMQTYEHTVGREAVIAVQGGFDGQPLGGQRISAIVYRDGIMQEQFAGRLRHSGLRSLQVPIRGAGQYDVYVTVEKSANAAGTVIHFQGTPFPTLDNSH